MKTITCPACGHQSQLAEDGSCPHCGHVLKNGTVPEARSPLQKPPPPPEVGAWVIYPTPPEASEQARRTFREEEFLAGLREIEQTGGVRFEDFIDELERAAVES